jgi:hypothetical protein
MQKSGKSESQTESCRMFGLLLASLINICICVFCDVNSSLRSSGQQLFCLCGNKD